MLLIDNLMDHAKEGGYCFGWGWYMANDMQFFLITPFLLLLYSKNKYAGLGLMSLLLVGSLLASWIITYVNNYSFPIINPVHANNPNYMDHFYFRPYIRIAPYIMGLIHGCFYF